MDMNPFWRDNWDSIAVGGIILAIAAWLLAGA